MKITLAAFGIAKEIIGQGEMEIDIAHPATLASVRTYLNENYTDFTRLRSLSLAVNESYQEDDFELKDRDTVVIIPPVSGG